ncbi:MAG TPA: ATP-binding cassette domain-containing protein [Firmicutes bacterium]|nr:ATP-binding cassette domain-containing protein [Bacillota bacterium]
MENKKVLIRIRNLTKHFPIKKKSIFQRQQLYVQANDNITLDIYEGETLGLVGESGCGKSTLGRVVLQLYPQTSGTTLYYGRTLEEFKPKYVRRVISQLPSIVTDYERLVAEKGQDLLTADFNSLDRSARRVRSRYEDALRIAGGLVLADDLHEVARALEAEYEASTVYAPLAARLVDLEMNRDALEKLSDRTMEENQRLADCKREIEALMPQLNRAKQEFETKREVIEKLKERYASKEGFEQLDEMQDDGIDLSKLTASEMRELRRELQVIFQDPYSSLNPRLTVGQLISEALTAHNIFKAGSRMLEQYVLNLMDKCGLQAYTLHRYPHQFSGGQRQRIGIARALAPQPKFVVCDEPVSALDVSIQSQIINLLLDLKEQQKLTYLFISHDLSVVKFISDRVGVMYLGTLVELTTPDEIFENPLHPYTEALLEAIPTTEDEAKKELTVIEGDIPSPINPPSGCRFHTRCKYATEHCKQVVPEWREMKPGHFVACHYPLSNRGETVAQEAKSASA